MDNLNRSSSTFLRGGVLDFGVSGRGGQGQMDTPAPTLEEELKFTRSYQEHQFSFKNFPDDINNK